MIPESNPAFQAAWSAYIDRPDRQPSTIEGFTAGYEAREAEVERLRGALEDLCDEVSQAAESNFMCIEDKEAIHAAVEKAEARAALQPEQANAEIEDQDRDLQRAEEMSDFPEDNY